MRSTRTAAHRSAGAARVVPTTQTARAPRRRRAAPFFYANTPRRLITHYDARDADAQESKGRGAAPLVQDLERPRNIKRGAAPVQGRANHQTRTVLEQLRARSLAVCESSKFMTFMTVLTLYALFGDDAKLCLADSTAGRRLSWSRRNLCIMCFGVEIVLQCFAYQWYFRGFYFWVDFASTLSILTEIPAVMARSPLSRWERRRERRDAQGGQGLGRRPLSPSRRLRDSCGRRRAESASPAACARSAGTCSTLSTRRRRVATMAWTCSTPSRRRRVESGRLTRHTAGRPLATVQSNKDH